MQMPLDRVQKNKGGVVNPTTSEPYLEQPVLLFGLARRKICKERIIRGSQGHVN